MSDLRQVPSGIGNITVLQVSVPNKYSSRWCIALQRILLSLPEKKTVVAMGIKYHRIAFFLLEFNGLLHSSIQFPAHRNKDNQSV